MTALAVRNHEQLVAAGALAATGISVPLTLDEAKLLVPYVATVTSAARWWRADLANMLGSDYYEAIAQETGCAPSTVQQDAATAKAWPFELRVEGITFNHHRILNRYIDTMGYDVLRDVLQEAADTVPKPSPETMLAQFLNTVSPPRNYVYHPRYREFESWLSDVTGLEVTASNSTLWIATDKGEWRACAVVDSNGAPVIDWRFIQGD